MNDEKALISVIVPIYKAEKYLKRCIDSILSQSYKNLEIILVDDGSPDSCSQICEQYKARDNRVVVIHQENKGVALSRNVGLDIASGSYIAFVDSDDVISPVYIEQLYHTLISSKKKISICSYCREQDELSTKIKDENVIYSSYDAIKDMIIESAFPPAPWGKLYAVELFKDIRYPDVATGEDYCTTPMLCHASMEVAFVDNPLYYYYINEDSITKTKFNPKHLQYFEASKILNEFLQANYRDFVNIGLCRDVNIAIGYYIKMCRDLYDDEQHKKQVVDIIRRYYSLYLKSNYPLMKKIASFCFAHFPRICGFFIR